MENEVIQANQITLTEGVHMTHPRFIRWLNDTFSKSSGVPFTAQDAYGYVKRQILPYHYGIYSLSETYHEEIGVKIITITDLNNK